jgi:excisionase family DNA binding protein
METKVETKMVEVEREWYSYSLASAYSGLGRTKLTELVTSGQIPAAKIGKAVRISRAGLDEYMRKNLYAERAQA